MAIAFSRSLRSLQADRWRTTLVGLVVAVVLLAAWCSWFFFASIAFGETGHVAFVDENGFLVAEFPSNSLAKLHRGQAASVLLESGTSNKSTAVVAILTEVYADDLAPGHIRLAVSPRQSLLVNPQQARVEIILERLSPAQLALRYLGLAQSSDNNGQ